MGRILLASLIVLMFNTTVNSQKIYPISFEPIVTEKTCSGECVFYRLETDSYMYDLEDEKNEIIVKNLGSNLKDFKLFFYHDLIKTGESFTLKNKEDFSAIHVEFIIDQNIENPHLELKQFIKDKGFKKTISILDGIFHINSNKPYLNVSATCLDSVILAFPYKGTQTDLHLEKLIEGNYLTYKRGSYYCCYGNGIKVSTEANQKFRYSIIGCHTKLTHHEFELR